MALGDEGRSKHQLQTLSYQVSEGMMFYLVLDGTLFNKFQIEWMLL